MKNNSENSSRDQTNIPAEPEDETERDGSEPYLKSENPTHPGFSCFEQAELGVEVEVFKIEPRPYQTDAINMLRENFRNGAIRQVLCAATGAGKSIIMALMIMAALAKGSRVYFLCERRNLVEQFSEHLERLGIDHGVAMAKSSRWALGKPLQIGTAQTLERMGDVVKFDILFLDEVHMLMRKSIIKLFERFPHMKVVGATATPFHPRLGKYFTELVNVTTMAELVGNGFLVPFRIFAAKQIDTEGLRLKSTGEWEDEGLAERGKVIIGDIVSEYIRLSKQVHGGNFPKSICFSAGIAHGAELAEAFNDCGIRAIQLTCNDPEEYKRMVLADFARSDTEIKLLISADLLTRGFDQTDICHVILARPLRKSFSNHVQMVGRGARSHPGKTICIIQDHSGNWLRFQDDWDALFHNGVSEFDPVKDKTARADPHEREKKLLICPECDAVWQDKNTCFCPICGFERRKQSGIVEIDGELVEIGSKTHQQIDIEAEEKSMQEKQAFFQGLLGYAEAKHYNSGWAFHMYRAKFGVNPNFPMIPRTPSPEVIAFARHQLIKYRHARKNSH